MLLRYRNAKTVFARIRDSLLDSNHHIRGFDDRVNIFSLCKTKVFR